MNVKKRLKPLRGHKNSKLILSFSLVIIMLLTLSQWNVAPESSLNQDRVEISLRHVGDLVMRKHGDGQTPIPPIQHLSERVFRLNLPKELTLEPDHLVAATLEVFDEGFFKKALIQVYSDLSDDMVYGFEINTQADEEIPCLGRVLPKTNYKVQLTILDPVTSGHYSQAAIMGVAGFGLIMVLFVGFSTPGDEKEATGPIVEGLQLDLEKGLLQYENEQVNLTQKELRLTEILMQHAGQLVTRDHLIEEVWSKEGVVTGRSLDVFISRLRKKMAIHPQLQIVNKHGQGYVLEIAE